MECKKCKKILADDALYCDECGDWFAVNEQKAKVKQTIENNKDFIVKQLKTRIFLIVAILFSVILASKTISMLTGGIWGLLSGMLPFIFMLIATIGLWKGYTAKNAQDASKALLNASIYDAYNRVMHTISIVLLTIGGSILFFVLLVAGLAADGAASGMGSDDLGDSLLGGGIVSAFIILIAFAIPIAIVSVFRGIYLKRRAYFKHLANAANTGNYTASQAPVIGSYVVGGFNVLSAIFPIILSIAGKALLETLLGEITGELEGLGDIISGILDFVVASAFISGLGSLVSGGYLILSAVWMSNVHTAAMENKAKVAKEKARLEELEAATREAISIETRKQQAKEAAKRAEEEARRAEEEAKRAEEEAARRAADERARQAQASMQEQQQQMMMQMMMQMMQSNGISMPNVSPNAPAEAPVEAPVEAPTETPVETPVEATVEAPVGTDINESSAEATDKTDE